MITSDAISVVIQGPIVGSADAGERGTTRESIDSVRRWLPRAEVVISTWRGSDLRGLEYDRCVTSDDPGMGYILGAGEAVPTNLNRLLVSTRAGLAAVERPHALKLRTDYRLEHAGFLDYFAIYPGRAGEWRAFAERVIIPDHYARNPRRGAPWLFHPSDVAQFGRTEDLRRFWAAPLLSGRPDDLTPAEAALVGGDKAPFPVTRLYNEQYLWLSCLRNHGEIGLPRWNQTSPELQQLSELSLANNFVVLRRHQFGVASAKHPFDFPAWQSLYTHADWHALYRSYCDPGSRAPLDPASWLKDRTCAENRSLYARALRGLLVRSEYLKARV